MTRRTKILTAVAGAIALVSVVYLGGSSWMRPCEVFYYAPGSPHEKAAKIYRAYQDSLKSDTAEDREYWEDRLKDPVIVDLMYDGWHVFSPRNRCDLFGRASVTFGGTTLVLDKNDLRILKILRGQ